MQKTTLDCRCLLWLVIVLSIVCNSKVLAKKQVCVIGAGRAGLAAIKLVSDSINDFELVAFERNSDVGGLWIYRESADLDEHGLPAHSGIYEHLKTNIPKSRMVYPDYPDFHGRENSQIVSHKMVLEYMKNYTDHFQLRKYIQFDTLVTKVIPKKSFFKNVTWKVKIQNLNTSKESSVNCDYVMVCNGHYSKPNIPKIPGMETYPGQVMHSRSYRKPEHFANKTVVVLGAGDSGIDITIGLSNYAKKVYISDRHRHWNHPVEFAANVEKSSGVVSANGNKLTLQDNSTIVADAFIFCTGYLYDFPFLDKSSGIIVEKSQVRPLFLSSINVENPSMIFVGLRLFGSFFGTLYYNQVEYFLKVLKGEDNLPSFKDMLEESTYMLAEFNNL